MTLCLQDQHFLVCVNVGCELTIGQLGKFLPHELAMDGTPCMYAGNYQLDHGPKFVDPVKIVKLKYHIL